MRLHFLMQLLDLGSLGFAEMAGCNRLLKGGLFFLFLDWEKRLQLGLLGGIHGLSSRPVDGSGDKLDSFLCSYRSHYRSNGKSNLLPVIHHLAGSFKRPVDRLLYFLSDVVEHKAQLIFKLSDVGVYVLHHRILDTMKHTALRGYLIKHLIKLLEGDCLTLHISPHLLHDIFKYKTLGGPAIYLFTSDHSSGFSLIVECDHISELLASSLTNLREFVYNVCHVFDIVAVGYQLLTCISELSEIIHVVVGRVLKFFGEGRSFLRISEKNLHRTLDVLEIRSRGRDFTDHLSKTESSKGDS